VIDGASRDRRPCHPKQPDEAKMIRVKTKLLMVGLIMRPVSTNYCTRACQAFAPKQWADKLCPPARKQHHLQSTCENVDHPAETVDTLCTAIAQMRALTMGCPLYRRQSTGGRSCFVAAGAPVRTDADCLASGKSRKRRKLAG
jgi:hypothetical protein